MSDDFLKQTRKLDVKVSQEVINVAIPKSSSHCMISDAIREAYPNLRKISTDMQTIRFTDPKLDQRFVYLTPAAAQYALAKFDSGKNPGPFRFRLTRANLVQVHMSGSQDRKKLREKRKQRYKVKKQAAAPKSLRVENRHVGRARKRPLQPANRRIPKVAARREFGLKSMARLFKNSKVK